ncbi:hypothetical protein [Streptomyces sp. SLBN-115]|uniref:hypothetical protein n=1 Tax=Streptomyces sp. SLBN-115 TaxID=2768453 RepID=UPI0011682E46|nr:hypothetical protein [Streptomyces sp. SLBN-115]TQJ57513.1 hypothetical protein FBY34_5366 [Streptomyces sp. SLBN-115]
MDDLPHSVVDAEAPALPPKPAAYKRVRLPTRPVRAGRPAPVGTIDQVSGVEAAVPVPGRQADGGTAAVPVGARDPGGGGSGGA